MTPPPPASPDGPLGLPLLLDRLRSLLGRDHVDPAPPHLMCRPATTAEVAEVLSAAAIGGVQVSCARSPAALIHLDLQRMDQLVQVDEVSLLCEAQAGMTLLALSRQLRLRKLSLGPLPAPSLRRSLGAVLAAPRPSEASLSLGRLRDRVLRLSAVLPPGREMVLPVRSAPRRASGPDLKQALIGSAGRVAVITGAVLPLVGQLPEVRCAGFLFPRSLPAMQVLRELCAAHGGAGLTDVQVASTGLLEQAARALEVSLPPGPPGLPERAALLLRAEGLSPLVEALLRRAGQLALAAGGQELPAALAAFWLAPDLDAGADPREAFWPTGELPLPLCTPAELAQAFDGQQGPRLLCGLHLHGAALCVAGKPGEPGKPGKIVPPAPAPAAEGLAGALFRQLSQPSGQQLLV